MKPTQFLLLFRSEAGEQMARLVIDSLRTFGGPLRDSPVWAFGLDPDEPPRALAGCDGVQRLPLVVEPRYRDYAFAGKVAADSAVAALAQGDAEEMLDQFYMSAQAYLKAQDTDALKSASGRAAFALLDEVGGIRRAVGGGANPNRQLLAEVLVGKVQDIVG